ncbi:5'-nucleotidase domain-containing protein 1 [Clarias gariepinus]|uniref:5'-nucleotidase domain-containing protein 1 n=1 Tax=Clarias gariepinus TaxID=13013 RepID=UPI00234CB2AD|nr:5'-nucleotidase domain-containing protein 1 [Clarias gariepinus]
MSECFSLTDCDVIGFDLDHTLCRYHLKETCMLIYESFARYLVEHKGYDKDLLNVTPETWDFCFKGLVVDLEEGNLLKLAEDGTVLRASHGTRNLSTEEIVHYYGPKREWKYFNNLNTTFTRSAKFYFYDNYFDLPGALLCARVVDLLNKEGKEVTPDFWKDMVAAIDHNYNTSAFREDSGWYFPSVKRDPERYLQTCPESVCQWLRNLKESGKVLLLITSSHSDYCRLVCEHILGKDFEDLFDVIITNALKPGFFSLIPHQRPFRTLVSDVESGTGLPSLEKCGWFSQGNWLHLHDLLKSLTSKQQPKVVYFGDSMRSDMFPVVTFANWETVLILEEMEAEGMATEKDESSASNQNSAHNQGPAEKRGKFDECMKAPSAVSEQWGSYFMDVQLDEAGQERHMLTWCCSSIHKYSSVAIPSVESIAGLPLNFQFKRFSQTQPCTSGYYPSAPGSLLKREES